MSGRRVLNDVHSGLNPSVPARVVPVDSVTGIRRALAEAAADRLAVAVAGGRHAMGGQQFCSGGVVLDTAPLSRVLEFDREERTIEVESGIHWPALLTALQHAQRDDDQPLTFRQKQTGADRLSLGGAVSANVHGRGLSFPPLAADVEALTLIGADGELRRCSRDENSELFRLAIGGYGLFGVILSARLRLVPRRTLERVVEIRTADGLVDAFARKIEEGFTYGDFQFAIDPDDPGFLHQGVFSCYRPVAGDPPPPAGQRVLTTHDWKRLLLLTHVDKAKAWAGYSGHYAATSGQLYHSDAHQFSTYLDGYHRWVDETTGAANRASEMITEIYVPRDRLEDLLAETAAEFRARGVDVIYGTIRLIERDEDSFLAWAREPWACVIFNLHVVHTDAGLSDARDAFAALIDLAIARGGSYFLTYHRWARRDQVEACYPQFADFLAAKRLHDPDDRFATDWYRHQRALFR
jgi:FAD/FMN-containing dehydrogenase